MDFDFQRNILATSKCSDNSYSKILYTHFLQTFGTCEPETMC